MKKVLLSILIISILGILTYWGVVMFPFSGGVNEDAMALEQNRLVYEVQNGDIIFQTSKSSQSKAIQLATNSRYSHMGIIYKNADQLYVYEAVQPVKLTPLVEWINRGENGNYVVRRLKNANEILTPEALEKMRSYGERFMGKDYDIYFEWSDDNIYCSELVWKIYKEVTGIEIGQLEQLSSFDLTSEAVKSKMKERYGENIPMDEKVISPAAMFESDVLITVKSVE